MEGGFHALVRRGDERGLKAVIAEKEGRGTRELKETVGARDPFGNTPLHYAAEGRHDIALLLLACGPLVNGAFVDVADYDGSTPLHHGAANNAVESVLLLLEHGASIEAKDNDGYTALHHSAFNNSVEVLHRLLKAGSDLNARDAQEGTTALHLASFGGYHTAVQLLVAAGANIHATDNDGATPLHKAAFQGSLDCLKFLVSQGAEVNRKDNTLSTPLHLAAYQGQLECIQFLVQSGAKTTETNKHGRTPLQLAMAKGHLKCVEFLKKAQETTPAAPTPASPRVAPDVSAAQHHSQRDIPTNMSTDNDDSSDRSWVWTSDDDDNNENEEQGWIFDGSGERRAVVHKNKNSTHEATAQATSTAAAEQQPQEKKKKKKKKNLSDRQKKEKGDKDRKLNGIGKMIKTASLASFQLSPRSRRNEDLLERFSMLPAKEREDLKSHSSDAIDSIKEVAGDFIVRGGNGGGGGGGGFDRSESDLTENDGENEATLTSYLTDSDDSDDEFGEKEIDYSKLDKYGFLKDEGETSESSMKRRAMEASRALKWSKIIQHWEIYKRKKKLPKLHGRVAKGIPDCVRGTVWKLIVNARGVQKELGFSYPELCAKAHNTKDGRQIDLDIKRTYRNHFMFRDKKGMGQKALSNILKAYSIFNVDIGYCQGMADIAALLVMYMEEEEAWWTLVALIRRYAMQGLFSLGFPRLFQCFSVHEKLLQRYLPALHAHFVLFATRKLPFAWLINHPSCSDTFVNVNRDGQAKAGIETAMYATKWYMDIFLGALPFPVVLRVWDLYLWGGPDVVYRFSLSVLKHFESELLSLNFEDALSFINELPKRRIDTDELIKAYKKLQATIKTSKIVKLEEDYAAANQGVKFLVGARDLTKTITGEEASSPRGTNNATNGKKRRAGTVIMPFSPTSSAAKSSSAASAPPTSSVSLPSSPLLSDTTDPAASPDPQDKKEALQNLLKSM
ncbi:TBC domain containing protein [Acanthamoeba castellanii str. Neff]|uniref:TBC domain containing protein n=1 Tax=Acanthamoeba castellanii (strain ATCC 30010 / Neff) TaxID=1257118 RepID=L8GVT7_ACACF|nr:TBC domain containing protein [Acanthamoeba castellanii str. Neff]ELR16713.1 TBC domain containing protein [Acanthamoeba castellanii str. Neff]